MSVLVPSIFPACLVSAGGGCFPFTKGLFLINNIIMLNNNRVANTAHVTARAVISVQYVSR